MTLHTYDDVHAASLAYYDGDELPTDVFAGKYALQDLNEAFYELTPADMHRREAKEFARIERGYPNPVSEEEIFELISTWKVVPQGGPMSALGNPYQIQSLSNCFVVESPYDSYGGIMKTDQQEAQIMKRRGGVGFDISTIRPKGLVAANAARTTDGIAIFMDRFSNTCREVGQGGRRGALMLTISVHHPEVLTFANVKRDPKRVTGANVSIRMSDEFMNAVVKGEKYQQRFPVEAGLDHYVIDQWVDAREVWDNVVLAMRDCSEPGMLFWDTVRRMGPADAYDFFKSISTNPCVAGNTLIAVADGRNAVSIRELADEGKDVPVYSTNPVTGRVEIKWGRAPRLTKRGAEVWKLTLDDGSTLIATPDHMIMLRDRSYVELKDLKPGTSVFPFNSFNSNGYRQICNTGVDMIGGAKRNQRQYRLIHKFFGGHVDPKTHALHHIDFDSTNDAMSNLQVMLHEEHRALHAERMTGEKNPYHVMTEEWKQRFACHPGEKNGRYMKVTNEQLLDHGRRLFDTNGRITKEMWIAYAAEKVLPQHLNRKCRFGSWTNFANQVATNHKVVSVERAGVEDVYNLTVDDNHNYHVITSNEDEKFVVSSGICVKNCGEITLSAYDSCRLLFVNLLKFVIDPFKPTARFDFREFCRVSEIAQRLMDDLIDLELEAIDKIIAKVNADPEPDDVKVSELDLWRKIKVAAEQGRRTGLGITALADMFAALDMKYGCDESIAITEEIYKNLAMSSYRSSVRMAQERGAFPAFDAETEKDHPFISRIMDEDPELRTQYEQFGRRNIANTTTAPVGSGSIMVRTSSGCEPVFWIKSTRKRKLTDADKNARVDEVDDLGDKWQKYDVFHQGVKEWMKATGEIDIMKSPYYGSTIEEVDPLRKVDIQAAAQRWICHSISNTTNLPKNVEVKVVDDLCMKAWKTGCKGVTIYRIGSRKAVIVDESASQPDSQPLVITECHAPKRPKELECDVHRVSIKGQQYLVLVGLLAGVPYEIFAGLSQCVEVPRKTKKAFIIKNGKKDGIVTYNLRIPLAEDDELLLKDIVSLFDNPEHGALTRMISMSMRHGVPTQFLVEQLKKDKRSDLTSFSGVIARVLKGYIKDGTEVTGTETSDEKKCPECGEKLVYQSGGCVGCTSCAWSKC